MMMTMMMMVEVIMMKMVMIMMIIIIMIVNMMMMMILGNILMIMMMIMTMRIIIMNGSHFILTFFVVGDYTMCIYNGHKDNNDGIERLVAFNFRAIVQGENDYEFVGLQSELTGK